MLKFASARTRCPGRLSLGLRATHPLSISRRGLSTFQPHAALQTSPLPSREAWLASLQADASTCADHLWQVDLVSIRDAAFTLGCRTPEEETRFLHAAASALASEVAPIASLSLQLNDGETCVAAAQLLHRALSSGSLRALTLTLQPPSISTAAGARGAAGSGSGGGEVRALLDSLARLPHLLTLTSFALHVTSAPWDDDATASLAALVGSLRLQSLTLHHVPLRNGPYAALDALAKAVACSAESLETLDLKGMGPLLRHTSLAWPNGPDTLGTFRRLQHLDLGHTQLGDVGMMNVLAALRTAVGGWTRLRTLGLAQCDVSAYAVEKMRGDVPVQALEEEEHQSGGEAGAVRVEALNLSSNALPDAISDDLASCLLACRRLRSVDLRHNRLTRRSIGALLAALVHASDLRTLRLRANRIQDEGFQGLAPLCRYWPALEELDLTRCQLTSASLHALATALPLMPELRVLRLAGNDLHFVPPVASPTASATASGSDGNPGLFAYDPAYMRGNGGQDAAKVPTSYELDRRDRETGRVRYRGPTFEDAEPTAAPVDVFTALGEALNSCRQLNTLDLSDSSLSDDGFVKLTAPGLALPALHTLDLSANPLFHTVPTLDQLMALLWCTPGLRAFDASFTALGDLGLSMLCDGTVTDSSVGAVGVLTTLSDLRSLCLAHCGAMAGLGVEALASCLPQLASLEVLVLNGNLVSGDTTPLLALLESAQACPRLRHISLHQCTETLEAQAVLETSAARRALISAGVDVMV